jgi:hypothetical protein
MTTGAAAVTSKYEEVWVTRGGTKLVTAVLGEVVVAGTGAGELCVHPATSIASITIPMMRSILRIRGVFSNTRYYFFLGPCDTRSVPVWQSKKGIKNHQKTM